MIRARLRGEDRAPPQGRRACHRVCSRWSRSIWPSSASCPSVTRWRAATATRASSPGSFRRRTCPTRPTATPGGHRPQSARRALAHERRPGARDPPGLGRAGVLASRSVRCCGASHRPDVDAVRGSLKASLQRTTAISKRSRRRGAATSDILIDCQERLTARASTSRPRCSTARSEERDPSCCA